MTWTWDLIKEQANIIKHGIDFVLAQDVFNDPFYVSRFEMSYHGNDRWQSIGMVGPALLFVVHTLPEDGVAGRIISARKVSRHERKAYEEGEF